METSSAGVMSTSRLFSTVCRKFKPKESSDEIFDSSGLGELSQK